MKELFAPKEPSCGKHVVRVWMPSNNERDIVGEASTEQQHFFGRVHRLHMMPLIETLAEELVKLSQIILAVCSLDEDTLLCSSLNGTFAQMGEWRWCSERDCSRETSSDELCPCSEECVERFFGGQRVIDGGYGFDE